MPRLNSENADSIVRVLSMKPFCFNSNLCLVFWCLPFGNASP